MKSDKRIVELEKDVERLRSALSSLTEMHATQVGLNEFFLDSLQKQNNATLQLIGVLRQALDN